MSDIANPKLGTAEDIFKLLIWGPLTQAALTALFAASPVLNAWPLRQIISSVVDYVSDLIFSFLRLYLDLTAIKFLNAVHQDAFDHQMVKLKIIQTDKGLNSPEYKKAREDAKNTFSKFVRFGA